MSDIAGGDQQSSKEKVRIIIVETEIYTKTCFIFVQVEGLAQEVDNLKLAVEERVKTAESLQVMNHFRVYCTIIILNLVEIV